MIIYGDRNQDWTLIHSAYGINIEAKFGYYESPFGDPTEKVIEEISVNGRSVYLGNGHWIYADKVKGCINMEEDKDDLCYFFSKMHPLSEMDDWELENWFTKQYKNSIWKSHVRNRKIEDQRCQEMERQIAKREETKQKKLDKIKAEANKKKLRLITEYNTAYFVKIDKRKHKNSDEATDEMVLSFARQYPGNGIEIVEEREIC